jgi:PEP-CTERM motif
MTKKNFLSLAFLALCFVIVAAPASAAAVCTAGDLIWSAGVDQGYSCQLGNLLFDNFSVTNGFNDPTPTVAVTNPLTVGPTTYFSINPGLGPNQDIDLFFRVTVLTGQLYSVDLSVGGNLATVTERVCTNTIQGNPANNCAPTGVQLASLSNSSGLATVTVPLSSPSSVLYIHKDIGTAPGGGLSAFTESFTAVPEPMTLSLMGAGLLGIGLLGRRMRKR